jgi:hypothetical protein
MIHTVSSLRTRNRRVDRHLARAEIVLKAMQNGCSLNLQFTQNGPRWTLSDGRSIDGATAKLVTTSASVVPVGDCLFAGTASQTYRWWSDNQCE